MEIEGLPPGVQHGRVASESRAVHLGQTLYEEVVDALSWEWVDHAADDELIACLDAHPSNVRIAIELGQRGLTDRFLATYRLALRESLDQEDGGTLEGTISRLHQDLYHGAAIVPDDLLAIADDFVDETPAAEPVLMAAMLRTAETSPSTIAAKLRAWLARRVDAKRSAVAPTTP